MNKSISKPGKQRGFLGGGVGPSLLIFGCIATLAMKLGPDYNDHRSMKKALAALDEFYTGKDMAEVSNGAIYDQFDKYMSVNLIKSLTKDEFTVKRDKRDVIVIVDYERTIPFTDVASVVLHFHDELVL